MLLVLPVRTVLLYLAMGMSTYSTVAFLFTASAVEVHMVSTLLNLCTFGFGMYLVFQAVPALFAKIEGLESCRCCGEVEDKDKDKDKDTESCSESESENESLYVETNRQVRERDGTLVVTTTYKAVDETDEIREMVETPQEECPTEETTEFAELLKKE